MGGKLFSAERIDNSQYNFLVNYFKNKFEAMGRKVLVPESFKSKETHGDIDLIIEGPTMDSDVLKTSFDLTDNQISRNNTVISLHYQGRWQIDCCFHPLEYLGCAYSYQRGSDVGMLVGRLWHKLGFSYGHKGLIYPVKLNDCQHLGEVPVSKSTKSIFEFLGLDHQKWLKGFENELEIYEWISSSKYFNKDFYRLEDLNSVNRVRNAKRPSFTKFLEWCKDKEFENNFIPSKNKSENLWSAIVHFERFDLLAEINLVLKSYHRRQAANKRFNGLVAIEATGLQGKALGASLVAFRRELGLSDEDDWNEWRLARETEKISKIYLDFCKNSGIV